MINYIIKKMFYGSLVLWGVISLVFFLFQVMPGDPARMMLSQREDSKQLEIIKNQYGFDKPIFQQYFLYLNDISPISIHDISDEKSYTYLTKTKYNFISILSFNNRSLVVKFPYLRESFVKRGKTVNSVISETFPLTIVLALSSIIFAIIIGLILGIVTALHKDTFIDRFILFFSVFGMSLPSFFTSIIIAWFFAFILHDITGLNMTGSLFEVDDYGRGEYIVWKNLILPAITLGIRPLAVVIQLTRNSILDTLNEDFIRTAKAKGLSSFRILFIHALPNAFNPVVTSASGWLASMLAGAVFIEFIFGWNGLGKEIVYALNYMDLPVVMGAVLTLSICFVAITILTDLIYYLLDPKLRV